MFRRTVLALVLCAPITAWAGSGKTVELEITGLTRVACPYGVQLNLSKLSGVEKCNVSYKRDKAMLVFAEDATPDIQAVKGVVTELGFTPDKATMR